MFKWWLLPRLSQQTLRFKILVFTLMQQPLKEYANDVDVQWLAIEQDHYIWKKNHIFCKRFVITPKYGFHDKDNLQLVFKFSHIIRCGH